VAEEHLRPVDAMERAVAACHQALVDYQTGLLDEEQLRRALFHDGIILGDSEAWLLDIAAGGWSRYDGIGTERFPLDSDEGGITPRSFDAATLRRWQEGLRGLLPATGAR
jgi:hypothetical protein